MDELKARTIRPKNIVKTGDIYRYVNHEDGIATTGFPKRRTLLGYAQNFRFDNNTVPLMKSRYIELYPSKE